VLKLFEEMDFIIFILEFWEHGHVISQVVHQIQKCFSISVEEHLVVDFLALVHSTEHFVEERARNESQDVPLCHQVVGTTDVQSNDLAIQFGELFYFINLGPPDFPLIGNLNTFHVKPPPHLFVVPIEPLVVGEELASNSFKFFTLSHELLVDPDNIIIKHVLKCLNSFAPDGFDLCEALNPHNINYLRERPHEIWVQDIRGVSSATSTALS